MAGERAYRVKRKFLGKRALRRRPAATDNFSLAYATLDRVHAKSALRAVVSTHHRRLAQTPCDIHLNTRNIPSMLDGILVKSLLSSRCDLDTCRAPPNQRTNAIHPLDS